MIDDIDAVVASGAKIVPVPASRIKTLEVDFILEPLYEGELSQELTKKRLIEKLGQHIAEGLATFAKVLITQQRHDLGLQVRARVQVIVPKGPLDGS